MVITQQGIAATSQTLASQAAAQVLARGGSAMDAAIAANAIRQVRSRVPKATVTIRNAEATTLARCLTTQRDGDFDNSLLRTRFEAKPQEPPVLILAFPVITDDAEARR